MRNVANYFHRLTDIKADVEKFKSIEWFKLAGGHVHRSPWLPSTKWNTGTTRGVADPRDQLLGPAHAILRGVSQVLKVHR